MCTTSKFEKFTELFFELSYSERISLLNTYLSEYDFDSYLHSFDDDFFNTYFENNPIEAARATFFGNIQNWCDEYIRFNGYGNLKSFSEFQAAAIAEDYLHEIFESGLYTDFIDLSDFDEDEN